MIVRSSKPIEPARLQPSRRAAPMVTLAVAALIVGLAISTDGPFSKAINGVGGLLWIASGVVLARRLSGTARWRKGAVAAFAMTLCLVMFTKPSDLAWAAAGFTAAGLLLGFIMKSRRAEWGAFLAAIWLPVHLLVAVARAIERAARDLPATVRTDPPPTAALVPFAMVACALLGAGLAETIREKRSPAGERQQGD